MVAVQIWPAIGAERQDHVWPEAANLPDHHRHQGMKIQPVQVPVRIIQYCTLGYFEYLASLPELVAPHFRQLVIRPGLAAIRSRTAFGQAEHPRFRASFMGLQKRPGKPATLVIRMRCNA
jgi:hypothetical protein